eukprot:scaffold178827_cov49-Attheya_sp.AAC.3
MNTLIQDTQRTQLTSSTASRISRATFWSRGRRPGITLGLGLASRLDRSAPGPNSSENFFPFAVQFFDTQGAWRPGWAPSHLARFAMSLFAQLPPTLRRLFNNAT